MMVHWCLPAFRGCWMSACSAWLVLGSWALAQSESERPPETSSVPLRSQDDALPAAAPNDALLKSIQEKAALPALPQQLHQPLRIVPPPPGALSGPRALTPGSLPPREGARGPRLRRPAQERVATPSRWKAAEAMLRSARWLENDAATAAAEGHFDQSVQLRNMAASLREHVKQLMSFDP